MPLSPSSSPSNLHHAISSSFSDSDNGSRRSQFTYRHLSQLTSYSTTNPLRVIAHIDLDAFYAQCEMVRLGVPEDKPLAVQQWQGLIAVNYPAREAGINRHCDIKEAKKLCPDLISQHVATWREGDDKWAYRDDAAANIARDKVSLDPYRLQSRRILALVKETLPANLQRVEKASIDEVFLDLSAYVHSILISRFPELSAPPPYDDPTEKLPLPSTTALDWKADALVDLDEDQEAVDPDWDDVAILIGSEIIRDIRSQIRQKLGYTCSAGIASNKLISKLGSAFKKPNAQTVVRSRAVSKFLSDFKITKMRNLGGKLGEQVVSVFHTDLVKELLGVPVDQFKQKLGEDTGIWLHNTIRGVDTSEVNSRTQIKSMLSAKSFRPAINTFEQALRWLRIFAADIFARLIEEGVTENKRRPKSINLHHRHAGQTQSRQAGIHQGRPITEEVLFELSRDLLSQIVDGGRAWPCENLSLAVAGFEEGVKGNMGIGSFLVKGEEALSLRSASSASSISRPPSAGSDQPAKKRRVEQGPQGGIQRFFLFKQPASDDSESTSIPTHDTQPGTACSKMPDIPTDNVVGGDTANSADADADADGSGASSMHKNLESEIAHTNAQSTGHLTCSKCNASFQDCREFQSHQDWHMAKDLQQQEEEGEGQRRRRVSAGFAPGQPSTARPATTKASNNLSNKRSRGGKLERGQSRLKF